MSELIKPPFPDFPKKLWVYLDNPSNPREEFLYIGEVSPEKLPDEVSDGALVGVYRLEAVARVKRTLDLEEPR